METLIVDPGITAEPQISAVIEALGLRPVAVLGTHGHVDHVGDAHLFAQKYDIALYLAREDQAWLTRPGDGLGPRGEAMMLQIMGSATLPPVADVRGWEGPLRLAGLTVTPVAAPGHTPGSTLLRIASDTAEVVLTGDVLFKGTIGRTDLPGGSMLQMRESLAKLVETIEPGLLLLPGHGEPTELSAELAANPYLQPGALSNIEPG